jgi:DNA-binding NarL/FixJ family response regulator
MNWAYIVPAASLAFCCFFFFYFRSFIKKRTAAEELLAEYRTEVYRLIAEIDAATDRDALLVEERITVLKKLLEDTDRRISVYVRELDRSRSGEALYTSLGRGIRAALGPGERATRTEPGPVAAAPPERAAAAEAEAPVPAAPPRAEKSRKAHIAELAAGGLSAREIASRLDLSLSEVDLALSLLGLGE